MDWNLAWLRARMRALPLWRTNTMMITGAAFVAGAVGFGIGVWSNMPERPWITFDNLDATYERSSQVVKVTGTYTATRECSRATQKTRPEGPDPLQWEQRVIGTGREIVTYAPRPAPPQLEIGTHQFEQHIPLEEGISPDGWQVFVTVACGRDPVALRSKPVPVRYLEEEPS